MGMVAYMFSWFTPTFLFCFLNLIIVTIFIFSKSKTPNPTHLPRAPSFLNRVKSINFSLYNSQHYPETHHSEQPDPNPCPIETYDPRDEILVPDHVTKRESVTCEEAPAKEAVKMKKSASEKTIMVPDLEEVVRRRGPAMGRRRETTSFGEDEGVDAKADDFINRFRKQLMLQRLDSLLRYKEMLRRGS